jgi:protein FRA10AC1
VDGDQARRRAKKIPALRAFELPFVYLEAGERKEALVKVRMCGRCEGKLTWKPGQSSAKRDESVEEDRASEDEFKNVDRDETKRERRGEGGSRYGDDHRRRSCEREYHRDEKRNRHRSRSRSMSPKVEPRSRSRSRSPRRTRDRNLI